MSVRNLQYYALTVPDLAIGRDFFNDFGLETEERDGMIVCRCKGRDQDQVLLIEGGQKRLHHICLGTDAEGFEAITKSLEKAGAEITDPPNGGAGIGVWFRDFEGLLTNVRVAEEAPWNTEAIATFNGPGARNRLGRRSELCADPKVRPRRLGHIVMFTTDVKRKMQFYADVFGMRLSDRVRDFLNFLHLPTGSDHHVLAIAESWSYGLQHAAFEVGSIDEVGMGGRQLLDQGYIHVWGPGRHGPGSNVFFYIRDPWNSLAEYFCDMDYIPAGTDWQPDDWMDRVNTDIWGPSSPADFGTNFEVAKPR